MPAFEGAVALGYRYLETDAHVTSDGVCLAFHDDHLDRVTDRTGTIAELPYRLVREARVDGREPIPLLEDLIALRRSPCSPTRHARPGAVHLTGPTGRGSPARRVVRSSDR